MNESALQALAILPGEVKVPISFLRDNGLFRDRPGSEDEAPEDRWIILDEAAKQLRLSVSHLRSLFKNKRVPGAEKHRGKWGIWASALERYKAGPSTDSPALADHDA